jgi:hypothetical protein
MRRTRIERRRGRVAASEVEFIRGGKEVGLARPENIDRDFSIGLSD